MEKRKFLLYCPVWASVRERKFLLYCPDWAPVMVLCLTSLVWKIHLSLVLIHCESCCENLVWIWMYDFVYLLCLFVTWSDFVSSTTSAMYYRKWNGSFVKGHERNLIWLLKFRDWILCKFVFKTFDIIATTPGFLPGSFPAEPWIRLSIK